MPDTDDGIFVSLKFAQDVRIGALDLSAFLFDMNRLYVVAFRVEQDPYEIDESAFHGYGRSFFRLPKRYQLNVSTIRFQSPGLIIFSAAVACLTAVWTTLQIAEKIKFWPLQQEKLRLEVDKLRHEEALRPRAGEYLSLPMLPAASKPSRTKKPLATITGVGYEGADDAWRSRSRRLREIGERQRIEPILNLPVTKSAIKHPEANPLKPTDITVDVANDNRVY